MGLVLASIILGVFILGVIIMNWWLIGIAGAVIAFIALMPSDSRDIL